MFRTACAFAASFIILVGAGLIPALSQDAESEQEKWARLRSPGEQHKWLAQDVGEWEITGKMFLGPDRVVDMKGSSTVKMVFDRYAHEEYTISEGEGQYRGFGYIGYDNIAGEFQALYCGTSGTGMNIMRGQLNKDRTVLTLSAEWKDKALNSTRKEKVVITRKSSDETNVQMFEATGDHDLEKTLDLVYQRKK